LIPDAEGGQVGTPGPHIGVGRSAVADWRLAITRVVEEETDAAATPAKTIDRAKMRIASFIFGNLFLNFGMGDNQSPYN